MLQIVSANVLHRLTHVLGKHLENFVINREIVGMVNVNVHHLLKHVVEQHLFVAMGLVLEVNLTVFEISNWSNKIAFQSAQN